MNIIATWDDGAVQDLKLAELMAKYRIPSIFYWAWDMNRSRNMRKCRAWLNRDQCVHLANVFEIGSHSITHHELDKLSELDMVTETVESRKRWQDLLGQPIDSFCYPRGLYNDAVVEAVRFAGYSTARTTAVGTLDGFDADERGDTLRRGTTVHVGVNRAEYGGVSWQDFARIKLEEAWEREDSTFHLFGHSWEIENRQAWDNLESLLKELK